jgi:general secretion pathway protein D
MLAPKVTMYDGQMAEIADTSRQPFVTDVTKVVGDHGVAYQPVIKVLWEGTKIRLTPEVTADGHHLRCKLMFASIGDCKTFRSPRYPDAKGIKIQRPVVTTTNVECEVDIPTGQTLLIGGLFPQTVQRETERGMVSRLIGIRPAKVSSEQVMFIAITPRTVTPE